MPNLTAHIGIALECAADLRHSVIDDNLGSYILGTCAPDIRIIAGGTREEYHFAPVSNRVIGTGIKNLFKAHPRLGKGANLSEPTRAFMAGYISHLVADEAWIIQVYNPYFGNREVFRDHVLANVMDRAVQLEMDRQAVEKYHGMKQIGDHLTDAHVGVEVDFLSADTLAQWRQFLCAAIQREFTWERLKRMARRQYPEDDGTAQAIAERFVKNLPESLEDIYKLVPRKALEAYRRGIVREWSKIARGYLS